MPELDVTDLLLDPDLADVFSVSRREETVNDKGRSVVATQVYEGVVGVVTIATPDDLKRFDVAQITGRAICCITMWRLRGSGQGFQPDIITWDGVDYTVKAVDPYTRFGRGFVETIAFSMNAADPEPN